jgi:hypothetical protein
MIGQAPAEHDGLLGCGDHPID